MVKFGKSLGAFEVKTHLSQLLEQVKRGKSFTITKRGRPIAKLVPLSSRDPMSLRGSVKYHDDIVSPIDEAWDANA